MYKEIADSIIFVEGENRGRYPYSNSIIINDQIKVLIDTGLGFERTKQVSLDFPIDLILITHGHEDHIGGNLLFPKAKIAVHHSDAPAVRKVSKLIELFGATGTDLEQPVTQFIADLFKLEDSRVDRELKDGEEISLGKNRLQVIHTPGHSAGHCCYYLPDSGLLFLADIDLSSFGPNYGYLDSDLSAFIRSIEKIKHYNCDLAISSHKEIVQGYDLIRAKVDLYLNTIYERETSLLAFLDQKRSIEEIVEKALIYGRFPEPQAMYMLVEKTMILKHLDLLVAKDLVIYTGNGYIKNP